MPQGAAVPGVRDMVGRAVELLAELCGGLERNVGLRALVVDGWIEDRS